MWESCTYRWSWHLVFMLFRDIGAFVTFPHCLAHHRQPVHHSGGVILLASLYRWGLFVLCDTVDLCLSRMAEIRQGPAPLGRREKLSNTITMFHSLTGWRCTMTRLQPAFGPLFCGRCAACSCLGTQAQHPAGSRAGLSGRSMVRR